MNTIFKTTCVFILLSTIHLCQSKNLELISRWPDGPCTSVEVNGSYAYLNSGSAFEILDISDTANYKLMGKVDLNDFINDIKVSGNYAYIAGRSGIYIVDISNKSLPEKTSTISADRPNEELFVKDSFLYAAGSVSLSIYDINSPSSPKRAGSFDRHTTGSSVFVKDSLAYLACPDSGFFILNVEDKMNPYEIGRYSFKTNEPVDLYINDSLAYITCREIPTTHLYTHGQLYILDIKNPANIFKRSSVILHGFENARETDDAAGNKVTAMGNYVYLTHFSDVGNYLVIVDVSNPDTARGVTRMPVDEISDLSIKNNILYASAEHYGLLSFDISNPSAVKKLSDFKTAGNTNTVFRMGNYLYNANSFGGLKVINITDPYHPAEEFTFRRKFGSESCDRIFGKDSVLYAGFSVYHWYSEASPFYSANYAQLNFGLNNLPQLTKISEMPTDERYDIKVIGNNAYTATSYGFIIYDMTNPVYPVELYRDSIANVFKPEIAIKDKFLYVAAHSMGVMVYNVGNPAKTQLVKTIPVKYATIVETSGKYLYVSDYNGGLRIFDISDPLNPREAGSYKDNLNFDKLKIHKGHAFIFNLSENILKILNIERPESVSVVTMKKFNHYINDLYIDDDFIIISEPSIGFSIFKNDMTASVANNDNTIKSFTLLQNYPNPFNPTTTIGYSIIKAAKVKLTIFDALGKRVAIIVDEYKPAGSYSVIFDGSGLPSGVYFYRLESGKYNASRKFILMK